MPAAKKSPATKATKPARSPRGIKALDGLEVSLDNAQTAVTELRSDLSTGGRRLVKDVEAAVKKARRDLARTRKAIQGDLGDLGEALTPKRTNRKPAAKSTAKPAAKRAAKPAARTTRRTRAS